MKALIIGSGNFSARVSELLKNEEYYTICADGGYDHAKVAGIIPDILLGDMDSIKVKADIKAIIYPAEKNETDSEIALMYAIENGYKDIILTGVTGTRLDHTLNNIFLLKMANEHDVNAVIIDDCNEVYYTESQLELYGNEGEFFSIIPICGDICVSVENAKYPLSDEVLHFGKSRGISNEFLGKECIITIKKGSAIVIKSRD